MQHPIPKRQSSTRLNPQAADEMGFRAADRYLYPSGPLSRKEQALNELLPARNFNSTADLIFAVLIMLECIEDARPGSLPHLLKEFQLELRGS
jgi:hypothetical protein